MNMFFIGKDNWNSLNIVERELALNSTNNPLFIAFSKSIAYLCSAGSCRAACSQTLRGALLQIFWGWISSTLQFLPYEPITSNFFALDPSTSLLRASLRMTRRGKYIIMEGGLSTFSIFCGECRICTYQFLTLHLQKITGK